MDVAEKPLRQSVELGLAHLIRHDLHERVVPAFGTRADRDASQGTLICAPARGFFGWREPPAKEGLALVR